MRIKKSDVSRTIYFVAVDASDLLTREVSLTTPTVYYSIDGGSATAMTTPTITAVDSTNMPGIFKLAIDESAMVTLGSGINESELVLQIEAVEMADVTLSIEVFDGVDVTAISGDSAAADNLEAQYDGTGISGDKFPATQDQVGSLSVGAGGLSIEAVGYTSTTGSETLTFTATQALDGTVHTITNAGGNIDGFYEFNVGLNGKVTTVTWDGYVNSNNDEISVLGYDWISSTFKQVKTILGKNSSTVEEQTFTLTESMTGTGANSGVVRVQFLSSTAVTLNTDRILAVFTSVAAEVNILHAGIAQAGSSNTITLDTGANGTDGFYDHAVIVIHEGTGSEQHRIIVSYTGSSKIAKIAPPWDVQPDATSVFDIESGITHAETGWATIKIGTVISATSTTITLDSDASTVDDFYNNSLVFIDNGTSRGEYKVITDYVGSTKVATVHSAWKTTPDVTSEYIIEEGHPYITSELTDVSIRTEMDDNSTKLAAIVADTDVLPSAAEVVTAIMAHTGFTAGGTTTYGDLMKYTAAWIGGNVIDKSGTPGVITYGDIDDDSPVFDLDHGQNSPYRAVTII